MDIRVATAYIREVSKLDLPSEDVLRSCINAAQTLSRWAARSDVSEIEAAPVIMEAAKHVRSIIHKSSTILSSPIKANVLENLQSAYHDLRSFFFDDDEESEFEHMSEENNQDESSNSKEEHEQTKSSKELKKEYHLNGSADSSSHAKAKTKEQSDADYVACEKKAAKHLRILFCIIMIIFVVFSVLIVAIYAYVYHNHKKDFKLNSMRDAMYVQSAAANAVYATLWSTEGNFSLSKTEIFATLLHDLSFSRTEGNKRQTIYYDSQLPLIEFRGAQVNLRNHKSVSSVVTPRLYGMLCRQNLTYPVEQPHDVGTVYGVYAILTPNECANDATASGVFQYSTGTIREPFPFVLNYRRDTAGRYVQYNKDYNMVAALTIDDNTLEEFVVRKDALFGVQNVLSYMYGEWLLLTTAWVAVIVIGILCLHCVYLEIFTRVTFKAYRLAFAVLITATTAVGFTLIIFVVAHYSEVNLSELLSACNTLISRCVVGVTKSSLLVNNNATDTFFQNFFDETSNAGFLMSGDGSDVNPPSMQNVADKLNLEKIVREKRVLFSDKTEELNLVSTYLPDMDKFYVRVTKSAGTYFVYETVWLAIVGCIVIFLVTLSYLHLSPLRRLCKYGSGSPFLRYTLHGHKVRFVFYTFLVVILVCMAIVYSSYRMFIMNTITENLAEETMTILASFYHADNVVNYALNANDLPSTIIRSVFTRRTNTTKLVSELDIAYPESKQWPDKFYGAQLALSHLFTVVRNALSFATPFVNESSKSIRPQEQIRNMIATIDVNDTAAVVLERFPDSYSANEFGLTSKWIGVCIAIILLAVFISLSEWLYLQLWQKRIKRRHSEYIVVRVFIFALIVLSCAILIQFWVTESNVNSAIIRFAHAELGTIISSQVMLLFNYLQSTTQVTDMTQAKKLIYDFTSLISHVIGTSTNHYMRWFVLEDVDCVNCGTVGVVDAKGNVGSSFYLKQTINSLIPNCDVIDGGAIDPSIANTQFSFCVKTMSLMLNGTTTNIADGGNGGVDDQALSSFYIMALRPYDSTVENNLRMLRVNTIGMAIAMTVILLILFALVGWWVLHTVNSHDFALYSNTDITMLTHSELGEVSSIIKLTPYYYRLCWALALLLLCLSLVIFLTPISVVLQNIMYAITSPMVYISQDTQASEVITNATLMLKHFYYVSSISSTKQILDQIASVIGKSDKYEFVKESNKNDVLDVIAKTEDEIGELTEMEQYTFLGLFATGYDSYYTERADLYAKYIKIQDNMLKSIDNIVSVVPSIVKYNVTKETKQAAVELIEYMLHAREYLRKIYILDHISVNDDLVFTYSDDANSEWPFRNSNEMNADDLIAKSHAALNLLTAQMNKVLQNITNYVQNVFPQSTETNLLQKKIKAVMKFTSGCTVGDSNSDFWVAQRTLMHEYKYIENSYMYIPLRKEQEKYKQILSNTQNVLNARATDEISTRYYDDLNEVLTTKRPLENTRVATGMEQMSIIERNKEKLLPLFLITIITYCVLLFALMSCYCSMQASVQKTQCYLSGTDEVINKQNDQGGRLLSQKVKNSYVKKMNLKPVFILFVISIIIIIPYSITYVTISDTITSMSKEINVNALGINMIASAKNLETNLQGLMKTLWNSYQRNKLKKIDNYLKMTVSLSNYFIRNVKVCGMNDPLTRACFDNNKTINCNVLTSLTSLSQMVRALVKTVKNEAKVCSVAVPPNKRWTDAGSRTNYSMTILESMSPDDLYSSLAPYAVTSSSSNSSNASAKIYNYLKQQVLNKLKEASDSDAITLLQKYVDNVDILCGISDADLKVWHTVLAANRKDAAPIAVQFADFKQLVGSETLKKLSSADVQKEVTEIIDAYANLVKIANSPAEVIDLFTPPCNQTEPDSFTSLLGSYIGTAMYACKVSNIITEQSFRELYAYNRQLVPVSGSHLPKTPIVKLIASITDTVRGIITDHITPSTHRYSIVPAVDYPLVWHDEVKTFTSKMTSGMDMSTLITLTQLLLTITFAISIAGVILTAWLMEIV